MRKFLNVLLAGALVFPIVFALELPPGLVQLGEYQQQLAASITFLVALIAGMLTFTSPCGFVVLPMFFTYVFKERKRAVLMTASFALGMAVAFTLLGLIAGASATYLNEFKMPFAFVSGFVLVAFGILLFLNLGFSIFYFKLDHKKMSSALSTGLMGFFFAVGWTPCIGPVLAGILLVAANTGTALKGAALLATYAAGVSIPLLVVSALADRYDWANSSWIRGRHLQLRLFGRTVHTHTYNIISGLVLAGIGMIMIVQSGTFVFMERIPQFLPWTMDFFVDANDWLTTSVLASWWGNLIGVLLIAVIVWLVVRAARHKERPLREV